VVPLSACAPPGGLSHSHSLPFDGRPGGPSLPIELWLNDDCDRPCEPEETYLFVRSRSNTRTLEMMGVETIAWLLSGS
jgi:hypothetical protein